MSCCTVPFSAEHLDPKPIPMARRMLLTGGVPAAIAAPFIRRKGDGGGKDHPHRLL